MRCSASPTPSAGKCPSAPTPPHSRKQWDRCRCATHFFPSRSFPGANRISPSRGRRRAVTSPRTAIWTARSASRRRNCSSRRPAHCGWSCCTAARRCTHTTKRARARSHAHTRAPLTHGRSQCPPRLVSPARFSWLFQHPGFFLDALYLHPKQTADNNVQVVFDAITDLEKLLLPPMQDPGSAAAGAAAPVRSQACYMLEGTALSKVHKMFASLLCHPMQRPHEPLGLAGAAEPAPVFDYSPPPPAAAPAAAPLAATATTAPPPVVHVPGMAAAGAGRGAARQQIPGGDLFATSSGTSHW